MPRTRGKGDGEWCQMALNLILQWWQYFKILYGDTLYKYPEVYIMKGGNLYYQNYVLDEQCMSSFESIQ